MNFNNIVFLVIFGLIGISKFGIIASPVHNEEDELKNVQPIFEIGESSSKASKEAMEKQPAQQEPKAETASNKMPMDYGLQRVAAKAAGNVYAWLPADKQPKKVADIKPAAPLPPADYDVERVAAKAAGNVYAWLPADKQPKKLADIKPAAPAAPLPPADYDVERVSENAAESVYSWLPKELQPEMMTEGERVEFTAEVFQDI
ncbi:hypothetical protein niasHT_029803 [Heterodera trifolii]|uniref:Uncharacterized protein n=1 Tax=Heterodera trifolii TaxID=157864 RepID=A0ABD2K303_9BILA